VDFINFKSFLFTVTVEDDCTGTVISSSANMRLHLFRNHGIFDFSNDPQQFLLRYDRSKHYAVRSTKIAFFKKKIHKVGTHKFITIRINTFKMQLNRPLFSRITGYQLIFTLYWRFCCSETKICRLNLTVVLFRSDEIFVLYYRRFVLRRFHCTYIF